MIFQNLSNEAQKTVIKNIIQVGFLMPPNWAVAAFAGDPIKRKAIAAEYLRLGEEVHGASQEDWVDMAMKEKALAELINLWVADIEECLKCSPSRLPGRPLPVEEGE